MFGKVIQVYFLAIYFIGITSFDESVSLHCIGQNETIKASILEFMATWWINLQFYCNLSNKKQLVHKSALQMCFRAITFFCTNVLKEPIDVIYVNMCAYKHIIFQLIALQSFLEQLATNGEQQLNIEEKCQSFPCTLQYYIHANK